MKILFKSKEADIVSAAKKWKIDLNMDDNILYAELKPHFLGETPEVSLVSKPTGRAITFVRLSKLGFKYSVFKHDQFGIILARED